MANFNIHTSRSREHRTTLSTPHIAPKNASTTPSQSPRSPSLWQLSNERVAFEARFNATVACLDSPEGLEAHACLSLALQPASRDRKNAHELGMPAVGFSGYSLESDAALCSTVHNLICAPSRCQAHDPRGAQATQASTRRRGSALTWMGGGDHLICEDPGVPAAEVLQLTGSGREYKLFIKHIYITRRL